MTVGSWLLLWLKISGIAMAVIGWGYLGSMLFDVGRRGKSSLFHSVRPFEFGIIGFGFLYIFTSALSLFSAIGDFAHCTFVVLGIVGIGSMAWRFLRASRPDLRDCIWVCALTLFVTYGTAHTAWNYDAGLYHLQAVSYFREGALPLGIANVHTRLGFNSSWFSLSTLCSGPFFGRDGVFLLNAAAMIVFLGALITGVFQDWRGNTVGATCVYAGSSILLLFSSGVLFDWFGLSPSPDLPSSLSCIYAFFVYLAIAGGNSAPAAKTARSPSAARYLLLISSAVLAATAKSSQVPVLLLIVVALWPRGVRRLKDTWHREYRTALVLGGLMILCWVVQGLTTSGCLAFPAGISCVSFLPWAVEPSKATMAGNAIRTWAKAPGIPVDQIPAGFGWLPIWRDKMLPSREFVFVMAWVTAFLQVFGAIAIIRAGRTKAKSPASSPAGLVGGFIPALIVAFIGILYWFFGAPDPRFGLGFLVAAPSLTFSFMAARSLKRNTSVLPRTRIPLLAALILLAVGWQCYKLYRDKGTTAVWQHEPEPLIRSVVTAAGLTVKMPVVGDQCWEVSPPCTPEPIDMLHQSSTFGHVMYFHSYPTPPSVKMTQGDSRFSVAYGPETWGQEPITYAGKQHFVRWLQYETTLTVLSNLLQPQQVVVALDIATLSRPRQLRLSVNGQPTQVVHEITNDFWAAGPQTVRYPATLHPGPNQLRLRSDEPMDMLPGDRHVSFLLLDDVRITVRK